MNARDYPSITTSFIGKPLFWETILDVTIGFNISSNNKIVHAKKGFLMIEYFFIMSSSFILLKS